MVLPVPRPARARGYYLYDNNGRRIIDMYQNGGHGILGHRPGRLTNLMKNVISRGIFFDLPSVYTERFRKALSGYFTGYSTFRWFSSPASLCHALSLFWDKTVTLDDIKDCLTAGNDQEAGLRLWRPFRGDRWSGEQFIPVLPFSIGGAPVIFCLRDHLGDDELVSDEMSPLLLSGALRALYDMGQWKPVNDWNGIEHPLWERQGIYLYPSTDREVYSRLYNRFLDEGVWLSPRFPEPSIFPGEVSSGDQKKIGRLLALRKADL